MDFGTRDISQGGRKMKTLKDCTKEELLAELEKREDAEMIDRPKLIFAKNLQPLIDACEAYFDELASGNGEGSDLEHYIFEEAINVLYSRDAWEWINSRPTP
jgi:hypothetical protein